jgi:hypothetical protein
LSSIECAQVRIRRRPDQSNLGGKGVGRRWINSPDSLIWPQLRGRQMRLTLSDGEGASGELADLAGRISSRSQVAPELGPPGGLAALCRPEGQRASIDTSLLSGQPLHQVLDPDQAAIEHRLRRHHCTLNLLPPPLLRGRGRNPMAGTPGRVLGSLRDPCGLVRKGGSQTVHQLRQSGR